MTLFLWIALALVVIWIVAKFLFKAVGCAIHILLLAALVAIVLSFLH